MKRDHIIIACLMLISMIASPFALGRVDSTEYPAQPAVKLTASAETTIVKHPVELTATVVNGDGSPRSDESVIFTNLLIEGYFLSSSSKSSQTAVTDEYGIAKATWIPTKEGKGFLRAQITVDGQPRYGPVGIIVQNPGVTASPQMNKSARSYSTYVSVSQKGSVPQEAEVPVMESQASAPYAGAGSGSAVSGTSAPVIGPDFSITITPQNQNIVRGGTAKYVVRISDNRQTCLDGKTDSACGARLYTLSATQKTFHGSLEKNQVWLNPGEISTIPYTLQVDLKETEDSSAPSASYPIYFEVTRQDENGAWVTRNVEVYVNLVPQNIEKASFKMSINPSYQKVNGGDVAKYIVTITDKRTPCAYPTKTAPAVQVTQDVAVESPPVEYVTPSPNAGGSGGGSGGGYVEPQPGPVETKINTVKSAVTCGQYETYKVSVENMPLTWLLGYEYPQTVSGQDYVEKRAGYPVDVSLLPGGSQVLALIIYSSNNDGKYDFTVTVAPISKGFVSGSATATLVVGESVTPPPVTPPTFPNGQEVRVQLSKGWNLVSIPSGLVRFEKTVYDKKLIAFVWMEDTKEYMTIQKAKDTLGDKFNAYLAKHAFWVYAYNDQDFMTLVDGQETGVSLSPGWNLVPARTSFSGLFLSDMANGCDLTTVYQWNALAQQWTKLPTSHQFSSGDVGEGFLIKANNACTLVGGEVQPPVTPPDYPNECEAAGEYCGGITGSQCCTGYTCRLDGNYPNAGGICVKPTPSNTCKGEGESIPVIPNAPSCCAGLRLIPPRQKDLIGTKGICTAKCGNGVCDAASETAYNCPQDCGQIEMLCKDSDGGKNYYTPGIVTDVKRGTQSADYCISDGPLVEYYCQNGQVKSEEYMCPWICENGACINKPTVTPKNPLRLDSVSKMTIDHSYPFMNGGFLLVDLGMAENGWYGRRAGQLNLETGEFLPAYGDYQFSRDETAKDYYVRYGNKPNHVGISISKNSVTGPLSFDAFVATIDGNKAYFPAYSGDTSGYFMSFYVAEDGSTYYATRSHRQGYPDMGISEALAAAHLARKADSVVGASPFLFKAGYLPIAQPYQGGASPLFVKA